ncbi:hypothetical protein [Amycolatopsis sp. SID8362]|uniref:hypothetical protein n=1 Tax=Amycolatopsis sp. SID8362 TaxID=2690346 RepID=UPI00136EAB5B|nr:hypothetical protein [Amycolatopsis sp. SID8362]NBH07615.1 hypothetical protein [Amycolatopsis sp. SID8362]NED44311.1 hypothetical protein [Amycolatopsis sp. SID8362]
MNDTTPPDDPIGPPALPRASNAVDRRQALTGRRERRTVPGATTLITWPTIGLRED